MANRRYTQFFGTLHNAPVLMDCNFVVDNTDPAGITSLKGPGISNVYMNSGAPSATNPNPAAGYIVVQFQDNFNRFYFSNACVSAPLTGANLNISGVAQMTVGVPYVITAVGTSTQANWAAAGLPAGMVPAVGEPFIAQITGGGTGTGTVKAVGASGIDAIEVVGDAQTTFGANFNGASYIGRGSSGAYMIFKCLNAGAATAPAAGSLISLSFYMSNSRITVQGE